VLHKLVNRYLVDRSVASGTGLFNLNHLDWDDEMLRIVGATADRLSEHVATTTVVEGVEPRYAREMGVRPDSLVVIGAGDGLLSNLGAGSVEPGQATCTVGTSGAFRVLSREPKLDEKERTWCYLLTDEAWVVGGAINNAGLAYRWIRELLYHDEDAHAALDEEAGLAGAGSEGLVFLPYLSGERSPSWNPVARGVLFGLALHHNRRHLLRAVVEGVAYAMYAVLLAVEDVTGQTTEIRGSGGLLRSPLWVQVMADVCGREIVVPHVVETTALGAVLLAMYALGEITDLVQARERVPIGACYAPHAENHELYLRLFGIYERLYEGVASQFAEICEIQGISGACEGSSGSDPSLASV
jgi:gluconokinase